MSERDRLTKKVFIVKSRAEIKKTIRDTQIYWNESGMARFCDQQLEMYGPVYEDYHGINEEYWVHKETEYTHWIFPPIWLEDVILPEELFDI